MYLNKAPKWITIPSNLYREAAVIHSYAVLDGSSLATGFWGLESDKHWTEPRAYSLKIWSFLVSQSLNPLRTSQQSRLPCR